MKSWISSELRLITISLGAPLAWSNLYIYNNTVYEEVAFNTNFLVLLYRKKWVGYKFQFLQQIKTDLCLYQIYHGYTYSCDMCWVDVSRVCLTSRMGIWYVSLHNDLPCVGMAGHTNGTEKWSKMTSNFFEK